MNNNSGYLAFTRGAYGVNSPATTGGSPTTAIEVGNGISITVDSTKSGIETEVNSNINYIIKY